MKKFEVIVKPRAAKEIRRLEREAQSRTLALLRTLAENPYTGEALSGDLKGFWSLHFTCKRTEYRIIYEILAREVVVLIQKAGSRENIYKDFKRSKK
jgi:mRNA-degrading endonuclease RelE of RelBE toxin-antitoxin system